MSRKRRSKNEAMWSRQRTLARLLLLVCFLPLIRSWEWSDFVVSSSTSRSKTLSMDDIREMRARDIKWRLARKHGYLAEELASKLDKTELIHALAFEEEKIRLKEEDQVRREVVQTSIIFAIIAVFVVCLWPLLQRGYEVLLVNLVVYTDRKKLEATRCWELGSVVGLALVVVMFVINMMQAWLSTSVILSWVMRSKYFFPVPHIPIRPAQMMGGGVAQTSLASYGLNVGPMAISWSLRFLNSQVEKLTGYVLARRYKAVKKEAHANETPQERESRRATRRARKAARKEFTGDLSSSDTVRLPPNLPDNWMQPKQPVVPPSSASNDAFMQATHDVGDAAENFDSILDELD